MRAEGQIEIGREEVAFSEDFVNLLQGCDSRLHIAKSSALKGWCPSLELLLAAGSQPAGWCPSGFYTSGLTSNLI
jgi:hypothetical protein